MHSAVWILLLLVTFSGVILAQNAECPEGPDVAVIVVASVFGTLAVVLLVVGIIILYLWRRQKASKSEHKANKSQTDHGVGFINQAFNGDSPDGRNLKTIEEGEATTGYVTCEEFTPGKKAPTKSNGAGDPGKKTWASFPRAEFPGNNLHRNSSAGSLDNYIGVDPEVVSVRLQSHDFIGLGFNIAGSMRDGIYVSQVHNRGPAIESGKFKVGDRIKSVTISFENMVFEDALTILSYASPYPVIVTLQREKYACKERRPSDSSMQINHPLYRSQSLDALLKIGKEPIFKPQRSLSEMRASDLRNETVEQPTNNLLMENEGTQDSLNITMSDVHIFNEPNNKHPTGNTVVEITVHKTEEDRGNEPQYRNVSNFAVHENVFDDIEQTGALQHSSSVPEANLELENEMKQTSVKEGECESRSAQCAVDFDNIFNKIDDKYNNDHITVSADVNIMMSTPKPNQSAVEDEIDSDASPIKPRRKKKHPSVSSSSLEESDTSQLSSPMTPSKILLPLDDIVTETDIPLRSSQTASAPKQAVEEDTLVANRISRNTHASSNELDISAASDTMDSFVSINDISKTLVDYSMSMSDLECTIQPHFGEMEPVVEGTITAVKIERDAAVPSIDNQIQMPADTGLATMNGHEYSDSGVEMRKSKPTDEKSFEDMLLDENLNFSTKTFDSPTFPSWNTKERISGMSYDISMDEIGVIESEIQEELRISQTHTPRGGVAFEVRDNLVTGFPLNAEDDESRGSVIRAISYDHKFPSGNSENTSTARSGSLKEISAFDSNKHHFGENPLDWSGQRLVRSGSFSEIAMDNSITDWTDHNEIDRDDVIIVDVKGNNTSDLQLKHSNIFTSQENLTNMSDLSDSIKSDSSTSSQTNSPPPPLQKRMNDNNSNELETVFDLRQTTESVTISTKGDAPGSYTVVLNTNSDDDADC